MYHQGIKQLQQAVLTYGTDLEAYKRLGNIRAIQHPQAPYILFNYTNKATYDAAWNDVERVSRGLIIALSGEVIALPFQKFFNLSEQPETQVTTLPDEPCEITTKMDGSLGILYWHKDKPFIATRGSFTGDQAQWASAFLMRAYPGIQQMDRNITLLFEIIYPENRIVLNYGSERALYLIGAMNRTTGKDYTYSAIQGMSEVCGVPLVHLHEVRNIEQIIPLMKTHTGVEGWVVRYENGLRVKIKTEDYLRLHRMVVNLTPARIRDMLLVCEFDAFVMALPDELQEEAKTIAATLQTQANRQKEHIHHVYQRIRPFADTSRKAYAIEVMSHYKDISAYLFALVDGRDITPMILKNLDVRETEE